MLKYRKQQLKGSDFLKPLKLKVSITLDAPVVEETKKLAELDDRSLSQYINLILRNHLEQEKKQQQRRR